MNLDTGFYSIDNKEWNLVVDGKDYGPVKSLFKPFARCYDYEQSPEGKSIIDDFNQVQKTLDLLKQLEKWDDPKYVADQLKKLGFDNMEIMKIVNTMNKRNKK